MSIWIAKHEESEYFLKHGSDVARIGERDYGAEVKPVKAGMTFLNGEIVVIDKNTIGIQFVKPVNPLYDSRGYCVAHDGYKEWRGLYKS